MTQWGLDTLFNPAKRHMDEEKRRLQSTREQIGDNSGGRRIDLESGKVVIRKQDDEPDPEAGDPQPKPDKRRGRKNVTKDAAKNATKGATKGTGATEGTGGDTAKSKRPAAGAEPSAASIRAAERRKRQPR